MVSKQLFNRHLGQRALAFFRVPKHSMLNKGFEAAVKGISIVSLLLYICQFIVVILILFLSTCLAVTEKLNKSVCRLVGRSVDNLQYVYLQNERPWVQRTRTLFPPFFWGGGGGGGGEREREKRERRKKPSQQLKLFAILA